MGYAARHAKAADAAFGRRGNSRKQGPLRTMLRDDVRNQIVRTRNGGYTYISAQGQHVRLVPQQTPEGLRLVKP